MRMCGARQLVRRLVAATLTCALQLICLPVHALDREMSEIDFTIASWGLDDGLPATRIWSIAEDAAGYLWIGTDAGLVRFDGSAFRLWSPVEGPSLPKGAIMEVLSARDGSIWVGQGPVGDGVSRISSGRADNYGRADLGDSAINFILEDHRGTMWVGNADGLFYLQGSRWVRSSSAAGIERGAAYSGYEDSHGSLWIGTSNGIALRRSGDGRFQLLDRSRQLVNGFAEDLAGGIWVTDPVRGIRPHGDPRALRPNLTGAGTHALRDIRGNLWVATLDSGLWRVRADERAVEMSPIPAATNWPNDVLRALHEDRHGNIWVGADSGLYRLTPRKVATLTNVGRSRVMAGAPDGSVWIGTARDLLRVRGRSVAAYGPKEGLPEVPVTALSIDTSGALWVGMTSRIVRFQNQRFVSVDVPKTSQLFDIRALGATSNGTLWIYDDTEGLFTHRDGRLARFEAPPELSGRHVRCLYVDHSDAVWLSFTGGNVLVVRPDGTQQLHRLSDRQALVNTIYDDGRGAVWLGGSHGVSRVTPGGVVTVGQDRLPGYAVFSILRDDQRNLWLGGALGISRLPEQEFETAAAVTGYTPRYELFDSSDGLAGMPVWFGTPSAVRMADELWFVTTGGVTMIGPSHRDLKTEPPSIQIDGLLANGRPMVAHTGLTFPSNIRNIVLEYSVPTLTSPTKVRFRHRLTGIDSEWIDAGLRRDVSYANLAPGSYQFDVMAVSSDHGWSESAASLSFSIRPMFYQTGWFFGACIVALASVSALVWRIRIRQVRRQFSVIVAERVRMSREIHDTLLQGMVAVALQLDVMSEMARESSQPLSTNMVRLRKLIEGYIRETRDAIFDLRAPRSEGDFAELLDGTARAITVETGVRFDLAVHGEPRALDAGVVRQLLQVSREAVTNAVRHANAARIHIDVHYRSDALLVQVADDGQGFEADPGTDTPNRHFGLQTMRERVQQIGGTIEVRSSIGMGTSVEIVVPIAVHL